MIEKITKKMTITDVISNYPEAADIMRKYGLHCIGCMVASMEDIETGAKVHGLTDDQIKKMISEINKAISKKSE